LPLHERRNATPTIKHGAGVGGRKGPKLSPLASTLATGDALTHGQQKSENTFRHTFGTLLKANGEDVKTVQELLRHANSRITLEVYTQAVTSHKRAAQSKVIQMMVPIVGKKRRHKRWNKAGGKAHGDRRMTSLLCPDFAGT
jgi:hypothetical protein